MVVLTATNKLVSIATTLNGCFVRGLIESPASPLYQPRLTADFKLQRPNFICVSDALDPSAIERDYFD